MCRVSAGRTRKEMIDPALERAGWYLRDHSRVKIEIPVDGYDAEPWNGVTDYCLYRKAFQEQLSISGSATAREKTSELKEIEMLNDTLAELHT